MKLQAELNMDEIRDAIRRYVEAELQGTVLSNGIRLRMTKAHPGDPREHDFVSATVTYEK